ncbi:hypothetical protein B0H14DRAFT_2750833 [Mycena olivaceomarginata]|nr:hypothetical protein B0H14DRAFT_2750833 [Mycena olivaceomarginata]
MGFFHLVSIRLPPSRPIFFPSSPTFFPPCFNKRTLIFFAFVASSVVAAPVPKITLSFNGGNSEPVAAPVAAVDATAATGACDAASLKDNISQLKSDAQDILAVNFPFPDNIRSSPADAATFDTVVTAIDDAGTAAEAADFATVASKISFVQDTVSNLIGGKLQDGDVSSIVLDLFTDSKDGSSLAAACPSTAAPAAAAAPAPAAAPAALAVAAAAAPAACDASALTDNISQLKSDAQEILAVNFPFPDNVRSSPADAATFDTVVTAINDAGTAADAADFATAASKISFVQDTVSTLIGDKLQDGDVSSIVLDLFTDSKKGSSLATACA